MGDDWKEAGALSRFAVFDNLFVRDWGGLPLPLVLDKYLKAVASRGYTGLEGVCEPAGDRHVGPESLARQGGRLASRLLGPFFAIGHAF